MRRDDMFTRIPDGGKAGKLFWDNMPQGAIQYGKIGPADKMLFDRQPVK